MFPTHCTVAACRAAGCAAANGAGAAWRSPAPAGPTAMETSTSETPFGNVIVDVPELGAEAAGLVTVNVTVAVLPARAVMAEVVKAGAVRATAGGVDGDGAAGLVAGRAAEVPAGGDVAVVIPADSG